MYVYLYLGLLYNFYAIKFLLYEKHGMLQTSPYLTLMHRNNYLYFLTNANVNQQHYPNPNFVGE